MSITGLRGGNMIETFQAIFSACFDLLNTEITIAGFTFSWWSILVFGIIASVIAWFIGKYYGGDD